MFKEACMSFNSQHAGAVLEKAGQHREVTNRGCKTGGVAISKNNNVRNT